MLSRNRVCSLLFTYFVDYYFWTFPRSKFNFGRWRFDFVTIQEDMSEKESRTFWTMAVSLLYSIPKWWFKTLGRGGVRQKSSTSFSYGQGPEAVSMPELGTWWMNNQWWFLERNPHPPEPPVPDTFPIRELATSSPQKNLTWYQILYPKKIRI